MAFHLQNLFFRTTDFAETATYNTESSSDEILAIIDYEDNLEEYPGKVKALATIYVRASEVSSPKYGDTIEILGETWRVARISRGAESMWVLTCERDFRSKLR